MKKLFLLLSCAVSLLALSSNRYASAAKPIGIVVNGNEIHSDISPIVIKGHVLVPVRIVTEALGASVTWDAKLQTASIKKWNETVRLRVGLKTAHVSLGNYDSDVPIEPPAKLIDGSVYMPLRVLSQQFGYNVAWNKSAVVVSSPLSDANRAVLYKGDLQSARKLVMKLVGSNIIYYAHKPLVTTHAYENYSTTFLFPKGKVLRFFMIDSDETVSLVEVKDDFLLVTWQAHVDIRTQGFGMTKLFANHLLDATGQMPSIGTIFAYHYYGYAGDSSDERSGSIDVDGQSTENYVLKVGGEVTNMEGTILLTLPNEVRVEEPQY